jgi:hypothetical protein
MILLSASILADSGGGNIRIGYNFLDEDGNQSVYQQTFNDYEGVVLSLEGLRYTLDNGIYFDASLNNFALSNRNTRLGFGKNGLFGMALSDNRYRYIYDYEGGRYTRRQDSRGSLWIYPHRYIKIFGGVDYIDRTGSAFHHFDYIDPDINASALPVDYQQYNYHGGIRFQHKGYMMNFEYRTINFNDDVKSVRHQSRNNARVDFYFPVPAYEWIKLTGGYNYFKTKYDTTDFSISSDIVWGGFRADFLDFYTVSYNVLFDRSGSDSDLVKTDNIAHTMYMSRFWPRSAGFTVGYQYDIKDDVSDIVKANSFYFSGWVKPVSKVEFEGTLGSRIEKVKDGTRLLGDEDRLRFKFRIKYYYLSKNWLRLSFDSRNRKNEAIGSDIDFIRFSIDGNYMNTKYGSLTAGYYLSDGNYENPEQDYRFINHSLYLDYLSPRFFNFNLGAGLVYYRNLKDLDAERIDLLIRGTYQMPANYSLEFKYNVHNFDDFVLLDNYYTANIVEIDLVKEFSL